MGAIAIWAMSLNFSSSKSQKSSMSQFLKVEVFQSPIGFLSKPPFYTCFAFLDISLSREKGQRRLRVLSSYLPILLQYTWHLSSSASVHNSRSRILRRHTSYSDIFAYTNAKKLKLGRGRFLSNVNNGPRLWVAAAGPGYHSGRHHHKVRPTFSNLRPPRKARKRPLLDHFLPRRKF